MTSELRFQIIDDLLNEAKGLLKGSYKNPKIQTWEIRTRNFVNEEYGKEMVEVFETFISSAIVISGQEAEDHFDNMQKAIEFLESLKSEPPKQWQEPNEQKRQEKQRHSPNGQNITITGGNVTVYTGSGDNNIQNVTVLDVIHQISLEIEKLSESQEKRSVL